MRDIVKGVSLFANISDLDSLILADDGTIRDATEDALKQPGWCVVVSPPVGLSTKDQVSANSASPANHGTGLLNVLTVVSVRTNPKVNTGDSALNLFVAVRSIIKAALSWKPGPGERGFSLNPERPFEPDFEDVGCFTYDIRFLKSVSL
jgi:hypothetical protein